MKLKCNDGIVREFFISSVNETFANYDETTCKNCGAQFGVSDLKIVKPTLKEHSCKKTLQTNGLGEKLH